MSKVETKMRERYEKRVERDVDKPRKYRAGAKYQEPKSKAQTPTHGVYKLIFVRRNGSVKEAKRLEAPSVGALLDSAKRHGALFAIRYWPSRKGWRVLDARKAQCFDKVGSYGQRYPDWTGYRYLDAIFPNEDAAVMAAIALAAS